MKRGSTSVLLMALVAVCCLSLGEFAALRAQADPPEVAKAVQLIRDNGKMIALFAVPTYKFINCGHNDTRKLKDGGWEIVFTLNVDSTFFSNNIQMAFYFDQTGRYSWCKVLKSTTYYTPFHDAVGPADYEVLREVINELPEVNGNLKLLQQAEKFKSNAERLLAMYLQLQQIKQTVKNDG